MNDAQMNIDPPFKIKAMSYESVVYNLTPDLVVMQRGQNFNSDQVQIDAYGELWMVAFADLRPGQLSIPHRNELIPIVGPMGILVGNFSTVEWQVNRGEINWLGVTSFTVDLPAELQGKVIVFPWDRAIPQDVEALFQMIRDSDRKIEIEPQRLSSAVALKTKRFLERNYSEAILIQTVAENLDLSWAVMTREFKKSYGISPVEYRHKLRVFKALKKLSTGSDVTTAMAESGFTSSSQFFSQFKKHLGTQPNSYHYNERVVTPAPSV
ncbi:MAG: helix-turn-helix transcriptional regulator [Bdellovibrionales bacterium]|nr:helix-turn-helix transcriptional regulator [Bdellovibrionales bacterium]